MKSLRFPKPVCGHFDDWQNPEKRRGEAANLLAGKAGGREGEDSTSQRGLASAGLASQWAGTGPQTSGRVAAGVSRGLGGSGEGDVCMRNSHVFPSEFQLLLRAGWVWTLADYW